MSLRSLRDNLYSLTGLSSIDSSSSPSAVNMDIDSESVWVPSGGGVWSDGNGNGNGYGLFGWRYLLSGLGLGFNQSHHHHHYGDVTDWKNLFFWLAVFAIFILFAVITNPTESSFRAHLTELSFRRHLADIRRSETDETTQLSDEQAQLPSSSSSLSAHATPDRRSAASGTGIDTPTHNHTHTIAPFRFANHVAISLRTPTLLYRSFLICSITITSPLSPPAFLSDPTPPHLSKGKQASHIIKERHVIWFGCMGHWSLIGFVPSSVEWAWKFLKRSEREKGKKRNLDKAGVIEMRAVQNKEDSLPSSKAVVGHAISGSRNMRRSDSSSNLTDAFSLHPHPAQIANSPLAPESRRPSLVNLIGSPPSVLPADSPEIANSPIVSALKAELAAAQTVLTDLQAQLTAHEQLVFDAHAHLQKNLDEVRNRRKEDDAERQELKSRTKSLEEQKRQAEAARRDAEKKYKAVESVRDGLQSKISAAEGEIRELKGNMENSERSVRVIQEEGAKHVVMTQVAVEERKKEMEIVESEIGEIENRNEGLGQLIKEAEERLRAIIETGETARKIGPEEEMMMMAAAYEAAAQEGYLHGGYQQSHTTPGPPGPPTGGRGVQQDQWQSQAAAYMAEAGMPHLGYEYTARPAHSNSTGFGHLSKHPNSASTRDLEGLRRPDISGFEDFGPGAALHANQPQPSNRSTTPPSDSESDIYGHEPGSPYGGISSSFSANLLPQGLFRSLEGDQTPLVTGDEDLPETFDDPLSFDLDERSPVFKMAKEAEGNADDSASDSDDVDDDDDEEEEDEDDWKSPLPEPKQLKETKENSYKRSSSSSSSRLPPPSSSSSISMTGQTTANNLHSTNSPPAIPGLPALPGSRRWFSGTVSTDNIPSTFGGFMHSTTSNDSLNLPGYDSSPFAPTSSEKKALASAKWQPFGKRWPGFNDDSTTNGWPEQNSPATSNGNGNKTKDEDDKGEKKPYRFFSLRGKPSTGGTSP
ncbi:uncharacterized protein IL334_007227 [Kwoniella shivajii]|uniref:Uncharacterized protein n=1 Tax=Kwoniella shivajii TaxID=564305 RepID=A0ABZ1D9F9_9TREE|nr:hypothetical protein IL334_007227 [Kwoniella shivajii]